MYERSPRIGDRLTLWEFDCLRQMDAANPDLVVRRSLLVERLISGTERFRQQREDYLQVTDSHRCWVGC
jgi:hypothetical protein